MPVLDVVVTLSSAGTDAGPFTIKDNNNNTLVSGITRAQLLAGYRMDIFSEYPTITVTSTGSCTTSASGTVSYTPPTYNYYTVSKFDCDNSCAQIGTNGAYAALSTNTLTAGKHYYYGGYSWRVETTLSPAPASYDVVLSGLTANDSCTACQSAAATYYIYNAGRCQNCNGDPVSGYVYNYTLVSSPEPLAAGVFNNKVVLINGLYLILHVADGYVTDNSPVVNHMAEGNSTGFFGDCNTAQNCAGGGGGGNQFQ
jgi:hypothetical protein